MFMIFLALLGCIFLATVLVYGIKVVRDIFKAGVKHMNDDKPDWQGKF